MAKKIKRIAKLEFMAMKAKPGAELASLGINMPQFTQQFNDATKERAGEVVPVIITAYDDKSFDFILKTAPTAFKIKQLLNIQKGAQKSGTEVVATISQSQIKEIAEYKLPDLNTDNIEAAMRIVEGTAKNMGVKIEGKEEVSK
ncbi:50S ribosomal protein L11 [Spiroplasma endosymbiont of Crioceris asparagi]|uniref:50S ribosomal protein L11 n=1 Tax=Spiroplasma endosymbiont of Crioceris asparagi TaxID=3066286 RepID=UPI0030CF10D6